jgi:hypothetical protein
MDIDTTIRALFDKLNARKSKVDELKVQIAKSWKTNGSFLQFGATTPTNIQTAGVDTIEDLAVQLCMIEHGKKAAEQRLGRPIEQKVRGSSIDDWFNDFQKRLATINIREEEKQIELLEQRLNQVLSPEERRRIEVELLLKEI